MDLRCIGTINNADNGQVHSNLFRDTWQPFRPPEYDLRDCSRDNLIQLPPIPKLERSFDENRAMRS
jgi:hypothetical protein